MKGTEGAIEIDVVSVAVAAVVEAMMNERNENEVVAKRAKGNVTVGAMKEDDIASTTNGIVSIVVITKIVIRKEIIIAAEAVQVALDHKNGTTKGPKN